MFVKYLVWKRKLLEALVKNQACISTIVVLSQYFSVIINITYPGSNKLPNHELCPCLLSSIFVTNLVVKFLKHNDIGKVKFCKKVKTSVISNSTLTVPLANDCLLNHLRDIP